MTEEKEVFIFPPKEGFYNIQIEKCATHVVTDYSSNPSTSSVPS